MNTSLDKNRNMSEQAMNHCLNHKNIANTNMECQITFLKSKAIYEPLLKT